MPPARLAAPLDPFPEAKAILAASPTFLQKQTEMAKWAVFFTLLLAVAGRAAAVANNTVTVRRTFPALRLVIAVFAIIGMIYHLLERHMMDFDAHLSE